MSDQPFVLINTKHGAMIVNKNDYHLIASDKAYGVGFQLMNKGEYDTQEITETTQMIASRLANYGPGVVVVDCGANIGVLTIAWAKALHELGHVYAFEAQEKIFYAMAGNVILHNCLNVTARHTAVGATNGTISFPEPDYSKPASFGSFELKQRAQTEDIGQPIDYSKPTITVPLMTLDSLELPRLDFLKIDVEGMEEDVLKGALETIKRCKPQIFIEVLKSDIGALKTIFDSLGYSRQYSMGLSALCVHDSDPIKVKLADTPVPA